ncbi:MAG: flagellar hook basal-body protein [Opitutaceae bacterium]
MSLIGTMDSGVSALQTYEQGLEVIGNNIANVSTNGFKGSNAQYADSFSDVLQGSSASGSGATPDMQIGTGVQLASVTVNFAQGQITQTGVPTDLAVSGNGFFLVKSPSSSETYATRDGEFSINASGYLVDTQGDYVQGLTGGSAGSPPTTVGNIKLGTPPTGTQLQSVSIDNAGDFVETYSDGSTAVTNVVLLQNYSNPNALQNVGNNLYSNLTAAGPVGGGSLSAANNTAGTEGLGSIQAGAIEGSNVDLTQQFANLITTQRSFEAASRLITVSDTILGDIVDLKRS